VRDDDLAKESTVIEVVPCIKGMFEREHCIDDWLQAG
jgi:hypothetical protein